MAPLGESLPVGSYPRKVPGPQAEVAGYGFTLVPSGTFTGSLDVSYSHLPNADPAEETHWFPDTDLGTITLTSGTTTGRMVGNARCAWVRFKVTVATGTASVSLWVQNGRG